MCTSACPATAQANCQQGRACPLQRVNVPVQLDGPHYPTRSSRAGLAAAAWALVAFISLVALVASLAFTFGVIVRRFNLF